VKLRMAMPSTPIGNATWDAGPRQFVASLERKDLRQSGVPPLGWSIDWRIVMVLVAGR
jgi:hypothetical protein